MSTEDLSYPYLVRVNLMFESTLTSGSIDTS